MSNDLLLVAHRGGAAEAPENTFGAFRRALRLGIRWFEIDVQMTRDGALVVIHDETVDRTTNGTGAVGSLSFNEIRSLDAGSWFSPEYAGEKVPTLREVLELCVQAGAGVLIELKSPHLYPGIEQKVAALLGELWTGGAQNFWCISFDPQSLERLHGIDSGVPLGRLFEFSTTQYAIKDEWLDAFCPHFGTVLQFPGQVDEAHRLAKHVFTWTVNREEDMRRLAELGVDAIMSDHPTLLLRTLGG